MVNKIIHLLRKNYNKGLTITDLVALSKLSRSAVRIELAKLEGGDKVKFRKIGMAKLYYLIGE